MSSPVKSSNFFTEPVGVRNGTTAPRWVPVLGGLATGVGFLAVESHGIPRAAAATVAILMLLVVATIGRRRTTPRA